MLKRLMTILFIVLVTSLLCFVVIPYAHASSPIRVYVDPPQVVNQALVPNTTFNVSVKVDNVSLSNNLVGIQFNLTWDQNLLQGVSMQEVVFHETVPPSDYGNIWALTSTVANNSVVYAYTYHDLDAAMAAGYAPISGNHTIANITLKVKGTGKCSLHFAISKLGDPVGSPIGHDTFDGFFSNLPPPPPALFYVAPSAISNVSLIPPDNFTVDVSIVNASGVYGLEFQLSFNTSILSANSITPGSFIPGSVTPSTEVNNTAGFVKFNVSLSSSLDGSGALATISFQVQALGHTALHLYGVRLVDSSGQALPYATADGSFDNVLLAKLAVDPSLIIDPTLVPPATFMINVTLAEVRDLYGYQFNLTYDPNVLICLQVQIQDVLNETYYIPNQSIDNLKGFIFINVTYYQPGLPLNIDSPVLVVAIKFRVKSMGATNLTLTDTGLVDSTGQPITHEVYNGFFQSLIVDIGVVDLFASPTEFYKGQSTNITCTVTNEGNSTQSFVLNLYYNSTLLATVNVTSLAPSTNATITVTWSTTAVSPGKYVLSAQVPPLPFETHISDNNLTDGMVKVKIPGDINGDGAVDIYDALLASTAFGSSPGNPNWNQAADLNGDGTVDIYDMIILAGHFGQGI
ncbi:MAG: cohesin domain-containing protein [Candidatus Bathyarchaeia archaeon]